MGLWQNEAKIVNLFRRRASPTYRVGVSAEAEKLDCKNCNMQLGIVQSGFLAERSQIVQLFQWLLKGGTTFAAVKRGTESSVAGLVLGSGLRPRAS